MTPAIKQILKDIKDKKFQQVYLLHGDEPYYIDLIADAILEHTLEEHEKDFNLTIAYGKDAEPLALISEAKSFPMMSERRVVILREAQSLKGINDLERYVVQPNPSTIFVICHKYKTVDGRSGLAKASAKNGLVFKSEKIKDYLVPDYISKMCHEMSYSITPKASMLLSEFLGNDLSKIHNELSKLALLIEKGSQINEVHIEENIGISKDYNIFELVNAVGERDVPKAFKIVDYFSKNPKSGGLIQVTSQLFTFFSRLMRMHFMTFSGNDQVDSVALKVHPFVLKKYKQQLKIYPPKKISANIAFLSEYDLKSKGVGNATFDEMELMRELIYKILH
jgi:DNA polymerase-3 subunit delta